MTDGVPTPMTTRAALVLLLALALPLFVQLGSRGLNEPDEGRYGEIAREMVVTGDYLVPRLKGVPHYAKPPFTYWATALSFHCFGFNAWAARLPSALAALAAALAVFGIGRRMGGNRIGVLAAVALVTTLEFFALSQILTTDMLVCGAVCIALLGFWRWWSDPTRPRRGLLLFWGALAIGFLVKGPVPLAVALATVLVFLVVERRPRDLLDLGAWWGLPLVAAVGLPWYLWLVRLDPELMEFFVGAELVERVSEGRGRAKPFWYFFVVLPLALWPWTPLVVAAAMRGSDRSSARRFLLAWLLVPLVLFSCSASKLWTYILPLLPAGALLVGRLAAGVPARAAETTELAPDRGVGRAESVMAVLLPPLGLLRLVLGARRWRASSPTTRFAVAAGLAGVVLAVLLASVPRFEVDLGNNASFRALLQGLPSAPWRGALIPASPFPTDDPPVYPETAEPCVATWRFRFVAAGLYLLADRPEYVPNYGGGSLWELASREERDAASLSDLLVLLRSDRSVVLLTKRRYLAELEADLGRPLRILAAVGRGRDEMVALSNR